jgi:hypothetical protein
VTNGAQRHESPGGEIARQPDGRVRGETCDYCGAEALTWRKCKLICGQCGNIIKSCADL